MTNEIVKKKSIPRSMRRNPLTEWLRNALSDPDKPCTCTQLSLAHSDRGLDREVKSRPFATGVQWDVNDLAEEFYNYAIEDCKDDKGVEHLYKLLAFYGDKDTVPAEKRFRITPYGEDGTFEYLNDAPDAKGALAQAMRLSEQLVQGSFRLIAQVHGSSAAELAALRTENRELFTMAKDLMIKISESDHDREMKRLEFERSTAERKQWLGYAPVLVNTILGKEIFPQSTVDTTLVEAVAESMSEDDLKILATKLKPEHWGPLASRLEKYYKEKKKAIDDQKTTLRLVAGDKNPEDDAAGD
jgi:hypothetical protein